MLERYFWQWPIPAELRPAWVVSCFVAFAAVQLLARFAPAWLFLLVLSITLVPLLTKPTWARAKHCAVAAASFACILALCNFGRNSLADHLLVRASLGANTLIGVGLAYSTLAASVLSYLGYQLRRLGAL
jgi:hypothetical protein